VDDARQLRVGHPPSDDPRANVRPARRAVTGLLAGAACVLAVTAVFLPFRSDVTPATPALLYIVAVGLSAVVGGRAVAVAVALATTVTYSVAFIPPVGSLRVELREDVVGLVVFLLVAVTMGTLVAREAAGRRRAELREREVIALYADYQRAVEERELLAVEARRVEVLEEVDRQRSLLLRSVSHDLRTPLATIRTITSGLRGGTPYDPATRNELLDLVAGEIDRLDRFVANLLHLSRVEAGALRPSIEMIDVRELIERAVGRLGGVLAGRTVEVDAGGLPPVPADPTQLDLVLTNLLENAARHAPVGTTIALEAAVDGDALRLAVVDHGPGIDPAVERELFTAFAVGRGGATGIGLATCKAIVDAHDGTITAGETPGGGASFVVELPLRR
jgi:two-component system, OmpR family, sensor histidine kinase KdpD